MRKFNKRTLFFVVFCELIIASIILHIIILTWGTKLIIIPCIFGALFTVFFYYFKKTADNIIEIITIVGEKIVFINVKGDIFEYKMGALISVKQNVTCNGYDFLFDSGEIQRTYDYVKVKLFIGETDCTHLFNKVFNL